MLKKVALILWLMIFTFIFGIVMTLIGMFVGGNYITNTEFMGTIGYEAGGNFGFIFGLIIGAILSVFVYRKVLDNNK